MFHFSPLKKNIDSLAAAISGFIVILLLTNHGGIGISPDSVVYSSVAESLHNQGQLTDFAKRPVVDFPVFYPMFLSSIIFLTGLKPLIFGPYLNAFLFAALIYLAGNIMEQFAHRSKWYKIAVLSCIVLSPGLLEDYSMLWSETLFIVLLLLFIMSLHRYLQSNSRKALIAAAVVAGIASVTRYTGITLMGTGGLLLLLNTKIAWRKKLIDLLLFSIISPALLILNLTRNYMFSGTLTGLREHSVTPLIQNAHDAGVVFCDWLPFLHEQYAAATLVVIVLIACFAFICLRLFLQKKLFEDYLGIASVFSLLYLLFMIITASITRFETLDSRFLSPAFIPMLWCGSSWVVSASQQKRKLVKTGAIVFGTLIFLCFQYNQLAEDRENWNDVKDDGIPGYTEDDWKSSEMIQYIQSDSLPVRKNFSIYSDAADAVYFFTGKSGQFLPHREFDWQVQQFLNDPHCYVVWFNDAEDDDLVNLSFITSVKKMKLVKQFEDGAIYVNGE